MSSPLPPCACCARPGATWATPWGRTCGRCVSHDPRYFRPCVVRQARAERQWGGTLEQPRAEG